MASIEEILNDFGLKLVKDVKANMLAKDIEGTNGQESKLAGYLKSSGVVKKGNEISLTVGFGDKGYYWKYVEDGRRKGKRPPAKSIAAWIKSKALDPATKIQTLSQKFEDKKAQAEGRKARKIKKLPFDKATKSLSFLIARSIGKKGTIKRFGYKGANFFEPILNDGRLVKLGKDIKEQFKQDIILDVKFGK